jgi:hypothetical protein
MARADETLIRDDDLRQKLEEARGKFGFDIVARTLVATQEKRDQDRAVAEAKQAELNALTPVQRRQRIVREVIENEPVTPDSLRYIHSILALCGLPYRRLPEGTTEYERQNGRMAVVVQAGKLRTPDGTRVQQPVPFGPKARLLMAHLSSEAIRQNSATVEIANSLTSFMREMGIEPRGGPRGTIQPFKDQVNALAACRMEMSAWDGQKARTVDAKPFNKVEVWFPMTPDERILWPTTISFSDEFFGSLKRHAMPVNTNVLRHLANSARKLDLYFWLNYRLNSISTTLSLSWTALSNQFGDGFTRERDFRAQLADELGDLKELFPKLPLKVGEHGITIEPAEPTVLGIPVPRSKKKS